MWVAQRMPLRWSPVRQDYPAGGDVGQTPPGFSWEPMWVRNEESGEVSGLRADSNTKGFDTIGWERLRNVPVS